MHSCDPPPEPVPQGIGIPLRRAAFRGFEVSWQPRNVVGGDFYWFHQKAEKTYLLLGDCTGHGVSGAFMSLISTSLLDRIANEGKITDPAGMLSELGRLIQQALGQDRPGSPSDDGLDAAVCSFDAQTNTLTFSGVVLSLYQLKGGAVEEIRGDKQSVGYKASAGEQPFTNHTLTFEAGTRFVLISDGITDQIGEATGRAYGRKRFREVLVANAGAPLDILKAAVFDNLHGHQGTQVRRDNVTLIAFQPQ